MFKLESFLRYGFESESCAVNSLRSVPGQQRRDAEFAGHEQPGAGASAGFEKRSSGFHMTKE
jgi:hypothetical protein